MRECCQLEITHFHIQYVFPVMLLQTSNSPPKNSIILCVFIGEAWPHCVSHAFLTVCTNVRMSLIPPDATVILLLQISLSNSDRPFPSHVLNLSFLMGRNEEHIRAWGKMACDCVQVVHKYAHTCANTLKWEGTRSHMRKHCHRDMQIPPLEMMGWKS